VTILQYNKYYRGVSGEDGDGGKSDVEVGLIDVQSLATSVRQDRNEVNGAPNASTVYVIESSLLNCWGLVELNKVSSCTIVDCRACQQRSDWLMHHRPCRHAVLSFLLHARYSFSMFPF
jgi:hypothetical protein